MYLSEIEWKDERPGALVVACSDGRFQEHIDDFLKNRLGITQYDRLYMPGGPGALASSGLEFARADVFRAEYKFLREAHRFSEVILIFHSNSAEGPHAAMCADYARKLPQQSNVELRCQQEADVKDLLQMVFGWPPELKIYAYRAEVLENHKVNFVPLYRPEER